MQFFKLGESTAARRRFYLHLVDPTDGITTEAGEAGGQALISKNGNPFQKTSSTLSLIGGGSWLSGWSPFNRIRIVIDHTKVDSSLSWFPCMIRISSSCGSSSQDMTRVFDELGANKLKIAVTSDDGVTQLYVEIEKWDNVGEEAILWVSKSGWTISNTADTVIYLYYDSAHADNNSFVGVTGAAPAQAVWDG